MLVLSVFSLQIVFTNHVFETDWNNRSFSLFYDIRSMRKPLNKKSVADKIKVFLCDEILVTDKGKFINNKDMHQFLEQWNITFKNKLTPLKFNQTYRGKTCPFKSNARGKEFPLMKIQNST